MKRLNYDPIPSEYYLLDGKIYRVITVSSGTDEVVLEDIIDKKQYRVRFSIFKHAYERVWKSGEVAKLLNRSLRSLYRYEKKGQTKKPNKYLSYGGRRIRFYTKQDILEMHEMITDIHQGRPRKDNRTVNNTMPPMVDLLETMRGRFGV